MKLTYQVIHTAPPKEKPYTLSDGYGLNLLVQPNGSKWWRFRYRYAGKPKMISLGIYPTVSLKGAREQRDKIRVLLNDGVDPAQKRKEAKETLIISYQHRFESIARQWWSDWKTDKTERHAKAILDRLEKNIFPSMGDQPIQEITGPNFLRYIKQIEARGALSISKRVLNSCHQIFRYAITQGWLSTNPIANIKPSDVLKHPKITHYARLEANELPILLKKIEGYTGQTLTKLALKLMLFTFVRTGELIGARWDEFDLSESIWSIPDKRMKMRQKHIVPLSSQALTILEEIRAISGHLPILFPNERNQCRLMSSNTLLYALYNMGYRGKMTGHGFRGIASTLLHEQGYPHQQIELQLAHQTRNEVSAAYNYALYIPERKKMMQDWADYLEKMKA